MTTPFRSLPRFLLFDLKDYRNVSILYEGIKLDPATAIATTHTEQLNDIDEDGAKPIPWIWRSSNGAT